MTVYTQKIIFTLTKSAGLDEMPQYATYHLGLYCAHFGVSKIKDTFCRLLSRCFQGCSFLFRTCLYQDCCISSVLPWLGYVYSDLSLYQRQRTLI